MPEARIASTSGKPGITRAGRETGLLRLPRVANICCMATVPLLLTWSGGAAEIPLIPGPPAVQTAGKSPTPDNLAAGPPQISYTGGQLTIRALDASLSSVLAKVSMLVGVKLDLPEGAGGEVMPVVLLGPGPAREILASLLGGAHLDYMMQASGTDPEKLESVLIMPRAKPGSDGNGLEAATAPPRSPFARVAPRVAEPEQTEAASGNAVSSTLDTAVADASAANSQNPSAQPDQPIAPSSSPREVANAPRTSPVNPPTDLSPQSMSNQLQQMYQQRMQMTQQSRGTAAPVSQP